MVNDFPQTVQGRQIKEIIASFFHRRPVERIKHIAKWTIKCNFCVCLLHSAQYYNQIYRNNRFSANKCDSQRIIASK